jgi:hypothetical protein
MSFVTDRYGTFGGGFQFPGFSEGSSFGDAGWFGGNIVLGTVPDASSSWVLLSGACVALSALRRKLKG